MMKNRAKVIKKIEICKQMPILLSINKNYFHYSNISNHLLYSIASTLSSLLLKTCSTTQNTIFKLTLLHISRKSSIFAAVLKVPEHFGAFNNWSLHTKQAFIRFVVGARNSQFQISSNPNKATWMP